MLLLILHKKKSFLSQGTYFLAFISYLLMAWEAGVIS